MTRRIADVAVYGTDGSLQLEVEVKSRPGASTEWAAKMLRNMVVHEAVPTAPYFMLVLPDVTYLWQVQNLLRRPDNSWVETGIEPDYEFDTAQALGPYVDGSYDTLVGLSDEGLELLVASWLTDLMNSDLSGKEAGTDLHWFFDSGLCHAVKKGSVATEAAVP